MDDILRKFRQVGFTERHQKCVEMPAANVRIRKIIRGYELSFYDAIADKTLYLWLNDYDMEDNCEVVNGGESVVIIPEWWDRYKTNNPDDDEEYNPNKHCCERFWMDFCNCTK